MISNVVPLKPYTTTQLIEGLDLQKQHSITPPAVISPVIRSRDLPDEMQRVCADGERTTTLTSLAGKLLAQGRDTGEVIELARSWNSRNTPPLDDVKVVSTCESIARTHARNHGESATASAESLRPLFDLREARVSRILFSPPAPRRWLLKDLLLIGKVGAVVAPGGTGKSQLLLQLGVSVASGLPFLGCWEVEEPGGVLMLMAEDDQEEIHFRLHNIHSLIVSQQANAADISRRIESNLFIRSMVGEQNLMTVTSRNGVVPTGYSGRVVLTARQMPNLKLVVVDPASRFRGGIENSAEDVTRFVEELEYIRKQTGATVIVAHHTNKGSSTGGETNQNAARGSSAFSDGVRWQMNLSSLSKEEAKNLSILEERRRFYLISSVVKNNYAPPSEAMLLQRGEGGFLEKVDPQLVTQASQVNLLYQVQVILRREADKGRRFTRTSFEDVFGGTENPLNVGKNFLRAFLRRSVDEGTLWVDTKGYLLADAPIPSGSGAPSGRKLKKSKT